MKILICQFTIIITLFSSCMNNDELSDAYGNFEATEIMVSAEGNGKIIDLNITEGQNIAKNMIVGIIDTTQIYLKKQQLIASRAVIASKTSNITAQIDILKEQKKTLNIEKIRVENLLKDNAGTQKQLDDLIGKLNILEQQIKSIETQNAPIINQLKSIDVQIEQVEDQLKKSCILNPIDGTVLVKYADAMEVTSFGRPLYKIADMETMILRVYVSGSQLPNIKIGQEVRVVIDDQEKTNREMKGTISWISEKAEFTPKTIQTKEERVKLVYAVKVIVINDGSLKIGMPGEVNF